MHLPDLIIQIFIEFQGLMSAPTYRKMVLMVCGTLLAHGRRTVSSALKMLGFATEPNWSKYHNLLNRAKWSGLEATTLLFRLLLKTFVASNAPVEIVLDETLERRWGRKGRFRLENSKNFLKTAWFRSIDLFTLPDSSTSGFISAIPQPIFGYSYFKLTKLK